MSTTDPQSTGSSAGPTCGNCGAAVESTSVTCPACGVLLAAYQTAFGSSSQSAAYAPADSSATHAVPGADDGMRHDSSVSGSSSAMSSDTYQAPPSPPTTPPPSAPSTSASYTAPIHQARSSSPIGDALRSSQSQSGSALHQESLVASDAPVEELSRMASGNDDLAGMASGKDDLADMASGEDELARMAAGGNATLAEQVEAELTGAKVKFDGSDPVIEAPDVTISHPGEGEPEVVERNPASSSPPAASVTSRGTTALASHPRTAASSGTTRQKYQAPPIDWVDSGRPRTTTHTTATVGSSPNLDPAAKQVLITKAALIGCLPFVLLFSVIVWIFQGGNAGSTFFGVLFIAGVFYLLLKSAGVTSRKTTSMPIDTTWNAKNKR